MKPKSLLQSTLIFAIALLSFSCESDPGNQQELLIGQWELDKATSNGAPTERLAGLYFVFNADGSMATNLLPGMAEETRYKVDGNELVQYSEDMPDELVYTIEEIGDSTLTLNTVMRNFRFSFFLKKKAAEPAQ